MHAAWVSWLTTSLGGFVVLEGYGYLRFGSNGTLSHYIRYWTTLHPTMPYIMITATGILAYHLWATE